MLKEKIIIGGAQLGMKYGITNTRKNSDKNIINLINLCSDLGLIEFDTAPVYGNSEENLGKFINLKDKKKIKINTKLQLKNFKTYINDKNLLEKDILKSISNSLNNIYPAKINVLFFHDNVLFFKLINMFPTIINKIKIDFEILNIGVSIYTPEEFNMCLNFNFINVIQIPFNLLDYRWKKDINFTKFNKRNDLNIHVRSIFLQGLLLAKNKKQLKKFSFLSDVNHILNNLVIDLKRVNELDLILSYVSGHSFINKIIIGINSKQELFDLKSIYNNKPLTESEIKKVDENMPTLNLKYLDPRQW